MASASCYDEDVPNRVAEWKAASGEKRDADRIEQAA